MTYRNSPQRSSQTVPLHIAQRIEAERDALVEEVRRLQDAGQTNEATDAELQELRLDNQRLTELEEQVLSLTTENQKLSEALASSAKTDAAANESAIKMLSRRVQELEGDLSRSHRRSETEVEAARREQRAKLLSELGDVLDSTDLALRMNPDTGPWRDGIVGIRDQLVRFVNLNGATLTGKVGEPLNPHLHEAIAVVESTYSRGQIVEVHRHGIVLQDGTVARTALVVVAA